MTVELTSISIIHHLLQHQVRLDGVECTREVQEQQSYIRFRLLQVFAHMMKQCQYGVLGAYVRGVRANCIGSCLKRVAVRSLRRISLSVHLKWMLVSAAREEVILYSKLSLIHI